jgi:hypothetical protein
MKTAITQREAGRLVRAFTARTMIEQLGRSTSINLMLDGLGIKREVTLAEFRNLSAAFDEELEKLERRAGEDSTPKGREAMKAARAVLIVPTAAEVDR